MGQLEIVLARAEIEHLVSEYCHHIRDQAFDALMGLFVADEPVFRLLDRSGEGGVIRGRDAVRAFIASSASVGLPWPICSNHWIEVESSTQATGRVHAQFHYGSDGYRAKYLGTYHDIYEKEGGIWRFRERGIVSSPIE